MNHESIEREILSYNLKEVLNQLLSVDISRNNVKLLSKKENHIKECFLNFKEFEYVQEGVLACEQSETLY